MNELRLSYYTIAVKLLDNPGKYLLIHGYTGAVDVVNASLWNKLKYYSSETGLSKELVKSLQERGYLTPKSKEEELAYVGYLTNVLGRRNHMLLKKDFTLVVTYDCNFSCPYCFEMKNDYAPGYHKNWTITTRLVDKFFETMHVIEPNDNLRNKTISLFGGEPLLKENKEIVKYILDKGKGYSFVATSNGYDLDSYEELLGGNFIKGVQVTIDGTKETHDSRRIHSIQVKSFDKIIENIKFALSKDVAIKVRINVDADNVEDINKIDAFFKEKRFYESPIFAAYASFIGDVDNFNPDSYCTKSKDKITIGKFLNTLGSSNVNIGFEQQLYRNFYLALVKGKPLFLSPSHCNAHFSSFVFDPFGDIYSCLEVVGNEKEAIGSYSNGLKWSEEVRNKWFDRNILMDNRCKYCKYSLLCGGGCFAKKLANAGNASICNFAERMNAVVERIYDVYKNEI